MVTGYQAAFEPAMRAALAVARGPGTSQPDNPPIPGTSPDATPPSASPRPDVPVGAVVLDPAGNIIGQGGNQREAAHDPTAHAEIVAMRAAGQARHSWRLDECTLVVTLEPCTMCAGAALNARITRLVYGAADERAGAAGSVWDVLHDPRLGPPVEVVSGVLATECAAVLREFFGQLRP
jgi:tRNA(adenine34) deaminase